MFMFTERCNMPLNITDYRMHPANQASFLVKALLDQLYHIYQVRSNLVSKSLDVHNQWET